MHRNDSARAPTQRGRDETAVPPLLGGQLPLLVATSLAYLVSRRARTSSSNAQTQSARPPPTCDPFSPLPRALPFSLSRFLSLTYDPLSRCAFWLPVFSDRLTLLTNTPPLATPSPPSRSALPSIPFLPLRIYHALLPPFRLSPRPFRRCERQPRRPAPSREEVRLGDVGAAGWR